jgi:hypothetical protein
MLKRFFLLVLSAWLFASGVATAYAGPCGAPRVAAAGMAAPAAHCEMMAGDDQTTDESTHHSLCGCGCGAVRTLAPDMPAPALLTALDLKPVMVMGDDPSLVSRVLPPEPPPPKA